MSIFFGLIINSPILNQSRYQLALREIEQYISVHHQELRIKDSNNILSFRSYDGFNEFNLPRNCAYLSTNYYRIQQDFEEDYSQYKQMYIEVVWECLCILKENFPSKVGLFQENLEQFNAQHWENEVMRRQLNILQVKTSANNQLKSDEVEDVFAVLENCAAHKNIKGILLCMTVLQSDLVQPLTLTGLNINQLKLIEEVTGNVYKDLSFQNEYILPREIESCKKASQQLIDKINRVKSRADTVVSIPRNAGPMLTLRANQKFSTYDNQQNLSITSLIFQLKESQDFERIAYLLDLILNRNAALFTQLQSKRFDLIFYDHILKNYHSRASDSEVILNGVFASLALNYVSRSILESQNKNIYTDLLLSNDRFKLLLGLCEEAILNWLGKITNLEEGLMTPELMPQLIDIYQKIDSLGLSLKVHLERIQYEIAKALGISTHEGGTVRSLYENLRDVYSLSPSLAQFVESILQKI